jgi:hypothetical protein
MGTPAIDIAQEMWFAEVELLAWLAAAPDFNLAIAQLIEVDMGSIDETVFANEDTWEIFRAISETDSEFPPTLADRNRIRAEKIARNLRLLLQWDESNTTQAIGNRWGPGPIDALLTRLTWNPTAQSRAYESLRRMRERHNRAEGSTHATA